MDLGIKGRWALVGGASKGLGLGCARALAREGVNVVLVARGDIIDESAERVRPGTLLWYRLACFLPARLPASAGGADPALAKDWRDALASLGPCGKTN